MQWWPSSLTHICGASGRWFHYHCYHAPLWICKLRTGRIDVILWSKSCKLWGKSQKGPASTISANCKIVIHVYVRRLGLAFGSFAYTVIHNGPPPLRLQLRVSTSIQTHITRVPAVYLMKYARGLQFQLCFVLSSLDNNSLRIHVNYLLKIFIRVNCFIGIRVFALFSIYHMYCWNCLLPNHSKTQRSVNHNRGMYCFLFKWTRWWQDI